jgi:hypothetical protein
MITHLPHDVGENVIQGISGIPFIDNFEVVASGSWTAIQVRTAETKQVILQPRDQIDWYVATSSGGSTYFTIRGGAALQAPVVTTSGVTLFWVTANQPAIFELLVGG